MTAGAQRRLSRQLPGGRHVEVVARDILNGQTPVLGHTAFTPQECGQESLGLSPPERAARLKRSTAQSRDARDGLGIDRHRHGRFGPGGKMLDAERVLALRRIGRRRSRHDSETIHRDRFDGRPLQPRRKAIGARDASNRPLRQGAGDRASQRFGRHRLPQEVGRAEPHGIDGQLDRREGGHHDDACVRRARQQPPQRLEAVDARHLLVEKHDVVRASVAESGQPFLAIRGFADLVACRLERQPHHLANVRLVVDNEHLHERTSDRPVAGRRRVHPGERTRADWNRERERRPAAGFGLNREAAAVRLDDSPRDGEPETRATLRRVRHLHERLEDSRQVLARNAGARIGHRECDLPASLHAAHGNRAARGGGANRIREQIDDDPLNLLTIGKHLGQIGRHVDVQANTARVGLHAHRLGRVVSQRRTPEPAHARARCRQTRSSTDREARASGGRAASRRRGTPGPLAAAARSSGRANPPTADGCPSGDS